jgi:hypothetical protein
MNISSDTVTMYKNTTVGQLTPVDELKHIFNSIFEKNIVLVEENLIIGVYEGEITENLLLMNLVFLILYKFRISGFLIINCILLLSSFLRFVITIASLLVLLLYL